MACPACDHTMQNLGLTADRVFWCPRCGTIKSGDCVQHTKIVGACSRVLKARDEYMADDEQQYPDAVLDLLEQYVRPCVKESAHVPDRNPPPSRT